MRATKVVAVILLVSFVAAPAWGQRAKEPTVKEIVAATKKSKFSSIAAKSAAKAEETLTFTPVSLPLDVKPTDALKDGLVVGQLKVRNVAGIADGTYTYFVCLIGTGGKGTFKLFVVKDGKELVAGNLKQGFPRVAVKADKSISSEVAIRRGTVTKSRIAAELGVEIDVKLGAGDEKVLVTLTHPTSRTELIG